MRVSHFVHCVDPAHLSNYFLKRARKVRPSVKVNILSMHANGRCPPTSRYFLLPCMHATLTAFRVGDSHLSYRRRYITPSFSFTKVLRYVARAANQGTAQEQPRFVVARKTWVSVSPWVGQRFRMSIRSAGASIEAPAGSANVSTLW